MVQKKGAVPRTAPDEATDVVKEATTRFKAFQEDPNDTKSLPSDMRVAVFELVLKNGGAKEYDDVKSYFYKADNNAERAPAPRGRCQYCS